MSQIIHKILGFFKKFSISTGVGRNQYVIHNESFNNHFSDIAEDARKNPQILEENDKEINAAIDAELENK